MAQWKRAGPITQRSVDRNDLLLFFSRISERKEIKTVTSQVNKREYGKIYTTWPQKNHIQGLDFLKYLTPTGWRSGSVSGSKLPPAEFFQEFQLERTSKQLPHKATSEHTAKFTLHCLRRTTIQGRQFS